MYTCTCYNGEKKTNEDAVKACKIKNLEILNELQEKINKMDKM